MNDVNAMNAIILYKKRLIAEVEKKRWPISDRDKGEVLQEKYGHNGAIDDALEVIKKTK